MSRLWTMKLTASKKIFCISDRVACTVKGNMRIFLHRKPWFPANTYMVNGLQAENKRHIT